MSDDPKDRVEDAKDRVRTETALVLRRYARRVKKKAIPFVEETFANDPNADPDEVARQALEIAGKGLIPTKKPKELEQ